MYKFFSLLMLIILVSCTKKDKNVVDTSGIEAHVIVDRFEEQFYTATPKSLPNLKSKYPYLFPKQTNDSIWLERINNEDELELFKNSKAVLGDLETEKQQLKSLFQHVKYYFPKFENPKIITLLTLDYKTNVMYADSLLFVSLDSYLGRNNELYNGFPKYISQNFDKSHLVVDVAEKIIDKMFPKKRPRTFLEKMVAEGKKMYLLDGFLPTISDTEKIGYSAPKMTWMEANEIGVWRYFIENKLLDSTDQEVSLRFIKNAPFSKFYLSNDGDSPGKTGVYIGWQIVKAYMDKTDASLEKMLRTDAATIFKTSRYKPKK